MGINIKIEKKDLYLLVAIMVFFVGVGFVVAYGGTQPIVMGHSAGELEVSVGGVSKTLQAAVNDGSLARTGDKVWFTSTSGGQTLNSVGNIEGMFPLNDNQPKIHSCSGMSPTSGARLNIYAFCNLSTSNGKAYLNLTWRQIGTSAKGSSTSVGGPFIESANIGYSILGANYDGELFCRITSPTFGTYRLQIYENAHLGGSSGSGTNDLICESSPINM